MIRGENGEERVLKAQIQMPHPKGENKNLSHQNQAAQDVHQGNVAAETAQDASSTRGAGQSGERKGEEGKGGVAGEQDG